MINYQLVNLHMVCVLGVITIAFGFAEMRLQRRSVDDVRANLHDDFAEMVATLA